MSSKDDEVKVKTRWRMVDGGLSSAWRRLVQKLCASRKGEKKDTHKKQSLRLSGGKGNMAATGATTHG